MPLHLNMTSYVRNGQDPILIAEVISDNTFNLGMKSHDLKVFAWILLLVFILLSV